MTTAVSAVGSSWSSHAGELLRKRGVGASGTSSFQGLLSSCTAQSRALYRFLGSRISGLPLLLGSRGFSVM